MSPNDSKASSSGNMSRKERRAAERAARKRSGGSATTSSGSAGGSGRSMLAISIVAVAIGLVAVVALVLASGGFGGDEAAGTIAEPDTPAPAAELRQGRTLVAPDAVAPVVVEVFEDVQCPHCQNFTSKVEPLLIAKHVKDGTASLTYNDFVIFGDKSRDAAMAMRAADELDGAFWDYHDVLYHNAPGAPFSRSWLADIAEQVGLDRDAFSELLDDDRLLAGIAADMERGAGYGVGSTPSVAVNGELLVAPSWADLDAAITEAAQATQS